MSTHAFVDELIQTIKKWFCENKDATSVQKIMKVDEEFESFVEEMDRWFQNPKYKSKPLDEALYFCEKTIEIVYEHK